MSISAIVSIEHLAMVRQQLADQGFGPSNFSVPAYAGPGATHAALHCWDHPAFRAALEAIPEVTVQESGAMNPTETTRKVITDAGAQWGADADELPSSGMVTAGTIYRLGDEEPELWYVIQSFSRTTYGAHPSTYPALIRRVRNPYAVEEWKKPLDQFDAYRLVNPFTGEPDRAFRDGIEYYVTQGDGAGLNTNMPGAQNGGWTPVGEDPPVEPTAQPWKQPGTVNPEGGVYPAYAIGDEVTHDNPNDGGAIWVYESTIDANTAEPGRDGTFDRWWTPVEPVA